MTVCDHGDNDRKGGFPKDAKFRALCLWKRLCIVRIVSSPGGFRYIEIAGLCAAFTMLVVTLARLVPSLDDESGLAIAGVVGGGYLAADFMTGVVHWLGDTVGSSEWPIVGQTFIRSFRHHHVDAKDIVRHDFVELNGANSIASLPLMIVAALLATVAPLASAFLVSMLVFAMGTNQIHQWAHDSSPPRFVRALQRARIILSPEHHEQHHTAPYDRAYCITTGWMNPLLDKLMVFRGAEWLIERIHPRLVSVETAQRRAR